MDLNPSTIIDVRISLSPERDLVGPLPSVVLPLPVASEGEYEGHDHEDKPEPAHGVGEEFARVEAAVEAVDEVSGLEVPMVVEFDKGSA
ncbi:hypothetical protein [Pelagicoccus sp. SDUM812002]|uniref:hypothetical protein n=1 Tax=Pelagicoccus sp. SDUM812002 TaxID=3041266 RepID=UPI0028104242|nr:hypothetical protein [Pelagicoccus sp. SDUM812002]MDQ8183946.1 hypothetical protein [Pelagicoccus sp. SDUM812002]